MDTQAPTADRIPALKRAMQDAIAAFRIPEARGHFEELTGELGVDPDGDEMLPSRVTLGILGGDLMDTLCMLNNLGADRAPGLKAICLRMLGDPLWERAAEEVEATSADPQERESMRLLLAGVRGS